MSIFKEAKTLKAKVFALYDKAQLVRRRGEAPVKVDSETLYFELAYANAVASLCDAELSYLVVAVQNLRNADEEKPQQIANIQYPEPMHIEARFYPFP